MGQKKIGSVVIDIQAGTAQFLADMDKANAGVKNFGAQAERMGGQFRQSIGGHAVPQMAAASAAIRTLEGNFNNNIRAAERFLGTTLGLSGVLQSAFPVVGAVAFGGVVYELTKKATEFYREYIDATNRIKVAFGSLNTETRLQNDTLAVTNDRLSNEIAKLSGRPTNGLKLALDEAREAADKLATSLDHSLKNLYKLLSEEEIGRLNSVFTKRAATTDIKRIIGGDTGVTGLVGDVNNAQFSLQESLDKAKNETEAVAARKAAKEQFTKLFNEAEAKLAQQLAFAQNKLGPEGKPDSTITSYDARIAELKATMLAVRQFRTATVLSDTNADLQAQKSKLESAKAASELERPFENRMGLLAQQLNALRAQVAAAGGTEAEKTLAKGYGEGLKVVQELNNHLKRQHSQLTDNQKAAIMGTTALIAQEQAREAFLNKIDGEVAKTKERIAVEELLASAIGKTFQVTRQASIEARVVGSVGVEQYNNPANGSQLSKLRQQFGEEFDAQHKRQVQDSISSLNKQIELERSLATVQAQGAEAVRAVTFAYRLRDLTAKGATAEQIRAEIALFEAQKANAAAANIAGINQEINAAQRLTEAYTRGAKAVRETQIALRSEALRRSGASQTEIDAEAAAMRAQHERDVTEAAMSTGMQYRNQLESIREQLDKLKQIKREQGDSLEIAISMKTLELEQNRILREQVLAVGTAKDGWRQFWKDLATDTESAAKKMYDTMSQAVSGINDNLAKMLSGQKANWGGFFQSLGERLIRLQIEQIERNVLGSFGNTGLGKVLGQQGSGNNGPWSEKIPGMGGVLNGAKRDGSSAPRALYVTLADGSIAPAAATSQKSSGWLGTLGAIIGATIGAGLGGGGSEGPTMEWGGPRAMGGPVRPGFAHLVGERGPEIFVPNQAGTVIPNSALGGAHYSITVDARGADEEAVERRVLKAVQAAHASAVNTSLQATFEIQKRRPGGR